MTLENWKSCKRLFKARNMTTFADWLRYYSNLDVESFTEALPKMRRFYQERDVDVLKDAVSLPGVSLQYLLRGPLKKENPPYLYDPNKEYSDMLKSFLGSGGTAYSIP